MQPDVIGSRYRVERAVGQGGMGTVWLCHDDILQRQVAVKQVGLLPGESATDSARAFREARSSAALSHRNVVTVFDVVEEEGRIWLVMEFVDGRSLSQMIEQDGALDPAVVADIGAQVAAGLAAAHAAGTTHRDVKPGNVLVSVDGVAKISDFGIARTAGDPALTQSGLLTGTPHYFSPELARGGDPGFANDVWALGATLYAAIEGRPPYRPSSNPVGVLHEIATQPTPKADRAAFLAPVLERMMDPDLASRWSMDDAAHVLGRLANEHRPEKTLRSTRPDGVPVSPAVPEPAPDPDPTGAQTQAAAPMEPTPEPVQPVHESVMSPAGRTKRRRGLPVLLGVVAVLAAIAAVLVVSQLSDGGQESPPASSANDAKADGQETDNQDTDGRDSGNQGSGSEDGASSEEAEKEQLVRDYYAAAPGGTDEAWAMLGPGMQEQGRDNYDAFWRTIEKVDVQSAEATPGSDSVQVTLVYHSNNGQRSTERKVEGLIDSGDGGYLIDSDEPAG